MSLTGEPHTLVTQSHEREPPLEPPPRRDSTSVDCPRCGYDLTPMRPPPGPARDASATCSECGLEFTWSGLLEARRQILPRFVEHAKPGAPLAISIPWTFSWLILPHRFWTRVTLERRINIWRAALWFLVVLTGLRVAETTIILCVYLYDAHSYAAMPKSLAEALELLRIAFDARRANARGAPSIELLAFMFPAFATLMFLILPQTRKRAKVRLALVLRCWFYANAMLAILLLWNALEVAYALPNLSPYSRPPTLNASMRIADALEDSSYLRRHNLIQILCAMTAWQTWYWYSALRLSLRVPHAAIITAAIVIPAALATFTAVVAGLTP